MLAMKRMGRLVCVLALAAGSSSIHAQSTFSLAIGPHGLTASNATKTSKVILFGDQVEPRTTFAAFFHGVNMVDSSVTGEAAFDLQRAIPQGAIWIAVDLATGDVAKAIPQGSPASEYIPDPATLKKDFSGNIAKLELPFTLADVLLVRPGEGAWQVSIADGGAKDDDHVQNGHTTASLDALGVFEKDKKPPKSLKKGDVLILIEPRSLRYSIIRVKE